MENCSEKPYSYCLSVDLTFTVYNFESELTCMTMAGLEADIHTFKRTSLGEVGYVCTEDVHTEIHNLPTLGGVTHVTYAIYK